MRNLITLADIREAYEDGDITIQGSYKGNPVILTALFEDGMSFVYDVVTCGEYFVSATDIDPFCEV